MMGYDDNGNQFGSVAATMHSKNTQVSKEDRRKEYIIFQEEKIDRLKAEIKQLKKQLDG